MTLVKRFNYDFPSFLFDGVLGRDMAESNWAPKTGLNIPAVNVLEADDNFTLEVAAPGFDKENFAVKYENNILTVSAHKENTQSDKKYTKREFGYNSFERKFTLPDTIDGERIEASYVNGVLKVYLPKKEEAKVKPARAIEIK